MNTCNKGQFQVLGKNGGKDQSKKKIPMASTQNYPPPSSLFQAPRLSALFPDHTFIFSRASHLGVIPTSPGTPPPPPKKKDKQTNKTIPC